MQKLIQSYCDYHPNPKKDKLLKAYEIAEVAYLGEKRLNGEDWLNYCLEVARLATDLHLDTTTICAAFLVDAYKFGITPEDVEKELGTQVRTMLDHLEQIREISHKYSATNLSRDYATYIQRLILITGKDIRVVALRLAQKLRSLDSIYVFNKAHREFVLKKAFNVYAPLADLIGMGKLKRMLEEKAFELEDHEKFLVSRNMVSSHSYAKDYKIVEIVEEIRKELEKNNVRDVDVYGRMKEPYSFYRKALRYAEEDGSDFQTASRRVYDALAFRIITIQVEDCYSALEVLHKKYPHIDSELDDYILRPKSNGYRGIHSIVDLGNRNYCELQIRTRDMHHYNEYGPAAHSYYKFNSMTAKDKESIKAVSDARIQMLQSLLKWKDTLFDAEKETIVQPLEDEILVFTPRGDLISLPQGSNSIDFAYALHTELGNKAVQAFVNNKLTPLTNSLENGDVINIKTDPHKKFPSPEWLSFVQTKRAKIAIKKGIIKKKALLTS